jgi:hypothetical protein
MIPTQTKTLSLFEGDMPRDSAACLGSKISKIIATRTKNTQERNERITAAFNKSTARRESVTMM